MTCEVTIWTQSGVQSQKIEYLLQLFLYRTKILCSCYTHHNCDISMATQWAPGPLHTKGKIRVFLLQEVLFAIVCSVGVSEYGHYTAQAQESLLTLEQQIRQFSFQEGRGLVMSVLLW